MSKEARLDCEGYKCEACSISCADRIAGRSAAIRAWMQVSKSQNAWVMRKLARGCTITQEEAKDQHGIARLAARINDLRDMGVEINSEMIEVTNRFNDTCRVARYWLKEI